MNPWQNDNQATFHPLFHTNISTGGPPTPGLGPSSSSIGAVHHLNSLSPTTTQQGGLSLQSTANHIHQLYMKANEAARAVELPTPLPSMDDQHQIIDISHHQNDQHNDKNGNAVCDRNFIDDDNNSTTTTTIIAGSHVNNNVHEENDDCRIIMTNIYGSSVCKKVDDEVYGIDKKDNFYENGDPNRCTPGLTLITSLNTVTTPPNANISEAVGSDDHNNEDSNGGACVGGLALSESNLSASKKNLMQHNSLKSYSNNNIRSNISTAHRKNTSIAVNRKATVTNKDVTDMPIQNIPVDSERASAALNTYYNMGGVDPASLVYYQQNHINQYNPPISYISASAATTHIPQDEVPIQHLQLQNQQLYNPSINNNNNNNNNMQQQQQLYQTYYAAFDNINSNNNFTPMLESEQASNNMNNNGSSINVNTQSNVDSSIIPYASPYYHLSTSPLMNNGGNAQQPQPQSINNHDDPPFQAMAGSWSGSTYVPNPVPSIDMFEIENLPFEWMLPYTPGISLSLGEAGRELLRTYIRNSAAGARGRVLQNTSIPELLRLAHGCGLWNVALKLHLEHTCKIPYSQAHAEMRNYKTFQSKRRRERNLQGGGLIRETGATSFSNMVTGEAAGMYIGGGSQYHHAAGAIGNALPVYDLNGTVLAVNGTASSLTGAGNDMNMVEGFTAGDLIYREGMTLKLGGDGRRQLLSSLRDFHDSHDTMDEALSRSGMKYSDIRNYTLPQLLKIAHMCGLWDYVIELHLAHISKKKNGHINNIHAIVPPVNSVVGKSSQYNDFVETDAKLLSMHPSSAVKRTVDMARTAASRPPSQAVGVSSMDPFAHLRTDVGDGRGAFVNVNNLSASECLNSGEFWALQQQQHNNSNNILPQQQFEELGSRSLAHHHEMMNDSPLMIDFDMGTGNCTMHSNANNDNGSCLRSFLPSPGPFIVDPNGNGGVILNTTHHLNQNPQQRDEHFV